MATVNKNTLAGRLAEKTNLSQKDAGRVLNALFGGKLDGNDNNGLIADAVEQRADLAPRLRSLLQPAPQGAHGSQPADQASD